jgi:predicted TIM-barrel fold metal-dependent hydrolase
LQRWISEGAINGIKRSPQTARHGRSHLAYSAFILTHTLTRPTLQPLEMRNQSLYLLPLALLHGTGYAQVNNATKEFPTRLEANGVIQPFWNRCDLPANAWDSHMHIIDPTRYPLSAEAVYTPSVSGTWDAVANETAFGMQHITVIQPSIYGNDNSILLDALTGLGPDRARGVVGFAPNISTATLHEWHAKGVRGVRLNAVSGGTAVNVTKFAGQLQTYADIIRPLGWVLQAYVDMEILAEVEDVISGLNITMVLDHFSNPDLPDLTPETQASFDPYSVKGFESLIRLIKAGNTYIKFSGAYRIEPSLLGLEVMAKEILKTRTDRTVFASDWPHTRFERLDIRPFIQTVLDWATEFECVDEVFATNARTLWRVDN